MNKDKLKVYLNKTHNGNLAYEEEQYIFNYTSDAKDVVSLTMPIRSASWNSKKLHPIFQMNLPEGALKEAIVNHFSKHHSVLAPSNILELNHSILLLPFH